MIYSSLIQTLLSVLESHQINRLRGSRTIPPVGNCTLPRRFLFISFIVVHLFCDVKVVFYEKKQREILPAYGGPKSFRPDQKPQTDHLCIIHLVSNDSLYSYILPRLLVNVNNFSHQTNPPFSSFKHP